MSILLASRSAVSGTIWKLVCGSDLRWIIFGIFDLADWGSMGADDEMRGVFTQVWGEEGVEGGE